MTNLALALEQDIAAGLTAAIKAGDLPEVKELPKVVINHPQDETLGEYASPIALALTKTMKKKPMDIVEVLAKHMPKKEYVGKLEAAAPGFLNIRISAGWMTARLDDVIEGDSNNDIQVGKGKLINMEFISANPTGPLTLGNARTAFSADTLANVFTAVGYNVTREYYINDAGGQIRTLGESVLRRALEAKGEKVEFPETMYQGEYISEIAQMISNKLKENEGKEFTVEDLQDEKVLEMVSNEALGSMLSKIQHTIKEDMKIEFDVWSSEKELRKSGLIEKVLDKLRKKDETYMKDGAEYLRTTKYGDTDDRVLVKKNKEYAYIGPDIGYHQSKYDRQFDIIMTFLGADHLGHAPKLKAAMQALGNDVTKLHFLFGQWLRLMQGGQPVKLSKRKGNIFTPKELIDAVGYDATRYFMVLHRLDTHMDFDLDIAKEQSERNPVYYVQYAFVRLQSILRRAKEEGVITEIGMKFDLTDTPALTHTSELSLMRTIYRYPEVILDISETFAIHQLPHYANDLAKAVHSFYKNVQVLSETNEHVKMSRLQLVLAAHKVLGEVLDLLHVSKPDVM